MIKFVPNILTCGRFVMTAIFFLMILYSPTAAETSNYWLVAFIFFVVTGLTDIIDGKIARKYNVTSKIGRILDPLADKVLVCGTFICFAIIGRPKLFDLSPSTLAVIHWGVVVILLLREITVTVIRQIAEAKGINFAATKSGKFKMFAQSFAIGTLIIKAGYVDAKWGEYFTAIVLLIMIITTVYSGLDSLVRRAKNKIEK